MKLLDKAFPGCVILGYTGRSVDEAASRVENAESATIHSWKLRRNVKERPHRILVLDEMSMISERLFMQLLCLVEYDRLVLVGDPAQLPAFGEWKGVILRELLEIFPSVELTENYRQKQNPNNKILPNCNKIRNGEWPLQFDRDTFKVRPAESGLAELIKEEVKTGFRHIHIECGTNPIVHQVNYRCVKALHAGFYSSHFKDLTDDSSMIKPPTFFTNTFAVGDRVIFTKSVNREMENDELDSFWNRKYYESTNQWEHKHRKLFRNGQQDYISKIYRITDYFKLKRFYWDNCKPLIDEDEESDEDDDYHYTSKKVCKENGEMSRVDAKKKKKPRFEDELTDDARTLDIPKDCAREILYYTRAKHQGPEFDHRKDTAVWNAMSLKEQDKEKYFQDNAILVIGESGRWFKIPDSFQHGFSMTVTKLQGSECEKAALYNPDYSTNNWMKRKFGRKFLMTAASRPKKEFIYLGENPNHMKEMIANNREDVCCLAHFFRMDHYDSPVQACDPVEHLDFDEEKEVEMLDDDDHDAEDEEKEEKMDLSSNLPFHECKQKHLLSCHGDVDCKAYCPPDSCMSKMSESQKEKISPTHIAKKNMAELKEITDPVERARRAGEQAREMISLMGLDSMHA
jgi:hypothetical protein